MIENARDTMNRIFAEASISPVRLQTRTKLQHQSKGSLRHLLSKLNRGTAILRGMIYIHGNVLTGLRCLNSRKAGRSTCSKRK